MTLATLVARSVPPEDYTTAMGVYNSLGDLGNFAGLLFAGAVATLGILAPFLLCAVLGVAGMAIGLSLLAAERSRELTSL